ncbi:MAG: hypothetical protein Q9M50_06510 [Methylococcales bacterium]|nr:hypothetical protein [Methylococcales bacterium]
MRKNNVKTTLTKFTAAWSVVGAMCMMQIGYIGLSYFLQADRPQNIIPVESRELMRSIFYLIAIINFPITNVIRHIQLRLNQTIPSHKPLNQRYLMTVVVAQVMMGTMGSLGFILFMLGDDFNTLYIFSFLAVLGFFLHRPKSEEYQSLKDNNHG